MSANPASVANQGEFHSRVPPSKPTSTSGNQPGHHVRNEAVPAFHAQTYTPGTAPSKDTYEPNPLNTIPGQALNPEAAPAGRTGALDMPGATSRDIHSASTFARPMEGQTGRELHGAHGVGKRKKERSGLEGVGATDSRSEETVEGRARALGADLPEGVERGVKVSGPGAEERVPCYESFRANGPFDAYNPYIPPSLDPDFPIVNLLSQLRTTIPPQMGNGTPLTPLLYQPTPQWFFPALYSNAVNQADSPFIILYPQRLDSQAPENGGLFVDTYDLRGIWLSAPPGPGNLTPLEEWLPLDYLLKQELSRWDSGRYAHDPSAQDGLKVQKWAPVPSTTNATTPLPNLQVAEAVSAWERLLHAIESRMPRSTPSTNNNREDPLRREALQDLHISTFAQDFLTHARRPSGWTFVAPGVGTFSEASLRSAYAAEPATAFRRTLETSEEGNDWVSLLLPSVTVAAITPNDAGATLVQAPVRVPTDVSQHPGSGINSFDKPYGFGKLTVDRRAGLYTSWADERDGDLVQLVTTEKYHA
ncbi:hypothetical protein F5144DRAFT_551862 [Chaetomium tenue]|uniref:Uncharacterized protein n=1 Tax=Chaetomium tenue TaxID=1854479 RepID=A0ACB7P0R2_9PEZI|nr:hypothetical protein F5144DRAFT_551862 [Chaetomium globosum]